MGRYNEILVGRYNRFVQKLFSMKGPASLVTLSDEMFAVFPFESGVENRYLEGWNLYGNTATTAPVAAQNGAVQLRNPVGSNVIAVIEKLVMRAGVASSTINLIVGPRTVDLGSGAGTGRAIDVRSGAGIAATCIMSFQSNQGPVNFTIANPGLLNASQDYDYILDHNTEIPLLPGDGLLAQIQQVNVALNLQLRWRERYLEESERT